MDAALKDDEIWQRFELDPHSLRETLLAKLQAGLPEGLQARLSTQHRMVAPIGNLISSVFYEGGLKSIRTQTSPVLSRILPKPVTWFSTSKLRERHERNNGASFLNPSEAQEILKIIDRVEFYSGALSGSKSPKPHVLKMRIAVLSGYAAQTDHIRELLEQKHGQWQHVEVVCHTVDAFQGREADLAIFSVTRSNTHKRAGFLSSPERINVGLSRGRDGLCIVGDAEFCKTLTGSPLSKVLDYMSGNEAECCLEGITQ
jgi:superfamily I DNA and/or RNA helicase